MLGFKSVCVRTSYTPQTHRVPHMDSILTYESKTNDAAVDLLAGTEQSEGYFDTVIETAANL